MAVIKAIIAARLPLRLSRRPDYSNAIGFDGKPIQPSTARTSRQRPGVRRPSAALAQPPFELPTRAASQTTALIS